jgi:hypothetical protein
MRKRRKFYNESGEELETYDLDEDIEVDDEEREYD